MSDILITLLLLVPILIVIAILNYASKKHKKRVKDKILAYLQEVSKQAGIVSNYQKHLIHQTVAIDEKSRKLLIVEHEGIFFSHDIYAFDDISDIKMVHQKQSVGSDEKGRKTEQLTTKIGLEISPGKKGTTTFLTFYDHIEHNIYQMARLEQEALELHMHILKTKASFK